MADREERLAGAGCELETGADDLDPGVRRGDPKGLGLRIHLGHEFALDQAEAVVGLGADAELGLSGSKILFLGAGMTSRLWQLQRFFGLPQDAFAQVEDEVEVREIFFHGLIRAGDVALQLGLFGFGGFSCEAFLDQAF